MPQPQGTYGTWASAGSPLGGMLWGASPGKKSEDTLEAGTQADYKSQHPEPTISQNGGLPPSSVLLFGLSANPPTGSRGHQGIVSFLAAQNRWDEIWVLPVYKHMHAKNQYLVDFEDRFQMCRLNFLQPSSDAAAGKSRTRVKVVRLEKEVAEEAVQAALQRGQGPETVKVGTIDVVTYAKKRLPDTEFTLTLGTFLFLERDGRRRMMDCLHPIFTHPPTQPQPPGTDTFNDIKKGKWKRGRELLDLVSVVIICRPGVPYTVLEEDLHNPRLFFYNVPALADISSTGVRKTTDPWLLRDTLDARVLDYIRERGLYAIGRMEGRSSRLSLASRNGGASVASSAAAARGREADSDDKGFGRRPRPWWPSARMAWTLLTGLLLCTGVVLAYKKWGWRRMEHGLLRVIKGLHRVEKDERR